MTEKVLKLQIIADEYHECKDSFDSPQLRQQSTTQHKRAADLFRRHFYAQERFAPFCIIDLLVRVDEYRRTATEAWLECEAVNRCDDIGLCAMSNRFEGRALHT